MVFADDLASGLKPRHARVSADENAVALAAGRRVSPRLVRLVVDPSAIFEPVEARLSRVQRARPGTQRSPGVVAVDFDRDDLHLRGPLPKHECCPVNSPFRSPTQSLA